MFNGTAVVDRFALRRLLGMRKLLVLSGVILGLVAPSAASATISSVFGTVTCTTQGAGASEGQRWCGNTANTTVPSWDGTPIDVSAAFPPATGADNNYPVVGIYHGWGSSKILPSSATAQRWLKLGYAVFSMTDRGWFSSCGATVAKEKPGPVRKRICPPDGQGLRSTRCPVPARPARRRRRDQPAGDRRHRRQLRRRRPNSWDRSRTASTDQPRTDSVDQPKRHTDENRRDSPRIRPWTDLPQALQPNGSNLDYVANAPYSGMLGNHEFGVEKRTGTNSSICAGARWPTTRRRPNEPEANNTEWYNFNQTGGPYNGKPLAIQQEEQLPNHGAYYTDLSVPRRRRSWRTAGTTTCSRSTRALITTTRSAPPIRTADRAVRLRSRPQPALGDARRRPPTRPS